MKSDQRRRKRPMYHVKSSSSDDKKDSLLELLAKSKGLIKINDKEYEDKQGNKFIKTPMGFVRKEKQNLKVEKYLSENSSAKSSRCQLEKNAKEEDCFEQMKQKIKELKSDISCLNNLLYQVIDKNTLTQNKIEKMEHNNQNQMAQIEKLKKAKKVLVRENENLRKKK